MNSRHAGPEAVALKGVGFRRSGRAILADVDWTVIEGDHWALLGANGSGKTTLLKIVTGYEWATTGTVEVLGHRFGHCNMPEVRKAIGWVSSAIEHRLPPRDTALGIVMSGLDSSLGLYRNFSEDEEQRSLATLDSVGIAQFAQRTYGSLSQGEQQRVVIARALVANPKLLILDEPCAGLDPAAREHFLEDLGKLLSREASPTLILVTHHIEEIGPFIDRVIVLGQGSALDQGAKNAVLTSTTMTKALKRESRVDCENGRYRLVVK